MASKQTAKKKSDQMEEEKPDKPDIIDEIKTDHRLVEEFYKNYKASKDKEQRKLWFNQFIWALTAHAVAEEAIVYSILESVNKKGMELGNKSRQDHEELKMMLVELSAENDEAAFDKKFDQAFNTLMEHVQMEESEDLVFMKEHVSLGARQIACEMWLMKDHLIPNKPHAWIPDRKAALELSMGVLVSPIDKVREMLMHHSQVLR